MLPGNNNNNNINNTQFSILCHLSEDVESQMRIGNTISSGMIDCINMFSIET